MYKRHGYYTDVGARIVFPNVLFGMIVVIVVVGFFTFFAWDSHNDTADANSEFNKYASAFNELSSEERAVVRPFMYHEDEIDEETGLLPIKECDKVGFFAYFRRHLCLIISLLLLAYSILVFVFYLKEKSSYYHFADIPYRTSYGFFLLISMFVFWPVLLIGRIHMFIKSYSGTKADKQALHEQAYKEAQEELLSEAIKPKLRDLANRKAENAYVRYIVNGRELARRARIREVDNALSLIQQNLAQYATYIRECQQRKSTLLAEKKQLEDAAESINQCRERARKEWATIREMRGVANLRAEKECLAIKVDVRVPYGGELYDFGDYLIKLYPDKYSCIRLRSGKRVNATSSAPDYNEPGGFCFGDRRSLIEDYIKEAQYLEALTLMIDSLHSVNDSWAEREIPNCFRKAKEFERAKRRLRKKLANQVS